MSLFDDLKALGADVDGGLKRINGNEKLYTKLLGSFIKSIDTYHVEADFDGNDYRESACDQRCIRESFSYTYI